ncbi:hypothetical protein ACP70R_028495 [Stipagrostis hirtigluma subsp. patula]
MPSSSGDAGSTAGTASSGGDARLRPFRRSWQGTRGERGRSREELHCTAIREGISIVHSFVPAGSVNPNNVCINKNMAMMARVLRNCVLAGRPVVEEVENGLLPMMETEGHRMLYVIVNHCSLVPIHNRHELHVRMYHRLDDILQYTNSAAYDAILGQVIYPNAFPGEWHTLVRSNTYLASIYGGSKYNTNLRGKKEAKLVVRFMRNGLMHGLQHAVDRKLKPRLRTELFDRIEIPRMKYSIMPLALHSFQRAMHDQAQLECLAIQYLFVS